MKTLDSLPRQTILSSQVTAFIALVFITMTFIATALPSYAVEYHVDPEYVTGPVACGECHEREVAVWKETHHFSTFKEMPDTDEAADIAKKMGIKRIESESDCLGCHFTSAIIEEKTKPIVGISCESCHGSGQDWIKEHADFGDKDDTAETETAEHKIQRYEYSEAAGMIRPSNLYFLVANCYDCHTVPNEKLVNTGGHTAGSKFELVGWTQGEIRHNVWYTEDNNEAPVERRRVLYVLGKLIDLEYALKGLANATQRAEYAISMAKRAKRAIAWLKRINKAADIADVKSALAIAKKTRLRLNNKEALLASSKAIGNIAKTFAQQTDGNQLQAIDKLLPKPDKYKGDVHKTADKKD